MSALAEYESQKGLKHFQVRMLFLILIVVAACTGMNTLLLNRAMNSQQVVLVPAGGLTEQVAVSRHMADKEYLRIVVDDALSLLLNYTPKTARVRMENLLTYYHSDFYAPALKNFTEIADDIEYSQASSAWYRETMNIKGNEHVVVVRGVRKQYIEDKMVESAVREYEVHYLFLEGRWFVKGINENKISQ